MLSSVSKEVYSKEFRIVGPLFASPQEDFQNFTHVVSQNLKLTSDNISPEEIYLKDKDDTEMVTFSLGSLNDSETEKIVMIVRLKLDCHREFEIIRAVASSQEFGYSIIDIDTGCLVPKNPQIFLADFHTPMPKAKEVYSHFSLKPQFLFIPDLYNQISNCWYATCLLYTSPSPRDRTRSRMPSSA